MIKLLFVFIWMYFIKQVGFPKFCLCTSNKQLVGSLGVFWLGFFVLTFVWFGGCGVFVLVFFFPETRISGQLCAEGLSELLRAQPSPASARLCPARYRCQPRQGKRRFGSLPAPCFSQAAAAQPGATLPGALGWTRVAAARPRGAASGGAARQSRPAAGSAPPARSVGPEHRPWSSQKHPPRLQRRGCKSRVLSWFPEGTGAEERAVSSLSHETGIMCCFYLTETPWGCTGAAEVRLRSETHWGAASRNALFVPSWPLRSSWQEKKMSHRTVSLSHLFYSSHQGNKREKKSLFLFITIIA